MIYVLLAAYNEARALPPLLDSLAALFEEKDWSYRVVLVDDGSSDGTATVAGEYSSRIPLDLICHGVNRGLGAAMRTGLTHLAGVCAPDDLVVTMDADNTHPPQTLADMYKKLEGGADVVIASRYAAGGRELGLGVHRKALSRGASLMLKMFLPVPGVKDYTCSFRMYRAQIIQRAVERYGKEFIVEDGFVCQAEILVKLAGLPARMAEVPLILRYDLKEGGSKMNKTRTILGYLRFVARERLRGY